jgi:hypothetical protein
VEGPLKEGGRTGGWGNGREKGREKGREEGRERERARERERVKRGYLGGDTNIRITLPRLAILACTNVLAQ